MSIGKRSVRVIGITVAAWAMLGAAVAPASAWPLPLTSDEINYVNAARGVLPGDDDQVLLAGKQMCRMLYTGQPSSAVIGQVSAQYGIGPDQAASALSAARGTMCTQAPG